MSRMHPVYCDDCGGVLDPGDFGGGITCKCPPTMQDRHNIDRILDELTEVASWDCANGGRCTGMGIPVWCAPHTAAMILAGSWANASTT